MPGVNDTKLVNERDWNSTACGYNLITTATTTVMIFVDDMASKEEIDLK